MKRFSFSVLLLGLFLGFGVRYFEHASHALEVVKPRQKGTQSLAAGGTVGLLGNGSKKLGYGPKGKKKLLRREGDFIVRARGRLIRGADGLRMLFAFDADTKTAPKPPMILLPCRTLETMEDLSKKRHHRVSFYVTGKIYTYKDRNYLMPTVMKLTGGSVNLSK